MGAAVTIVGALVLATVNHFFQIWRQTRQERRELHRQKLEDAHKCAISIKQWAIERQFDLHERLPSTPWIPPEADDFEVTQYTAPPVLTIEEGATITATIRTAVGDIEVELLPGQALEAVNSFVFLAQQGFYDGLQFHHVASP